MTGETPIPQRKTGALWGLAIGDALGAAVEFKSPGSFEPVTDYRGGGPHRIPAGAWTDDTSMALALADSICSIGWDLNDQAERYLRWWLHGEYSVNDECFDIGTTTSASLNRFRQTRDAHQSASRSESASGNGSIMRLAPVPIRFAELYPLQWAQLDRYARESSIVTHASGPCVSACRYLALVLAALIRGEPRETVLSPEWEGLNRLRALEPLHPEIDRVAGGSYRDPRTMIRGSGHVVKSLEAALWAFHDAADFSEAVLRAVNLGDDADTTGAVCGQLAGAYFGETAIPETWRNKLVRRDWIETAAQRLIRTP